MHLLQGEGVHLALRFRRRVDHLYRASILPAGSFARARERDARRRQPAAVTGPREPGPAKYRAANPTSAEFWRRVRSGEAGDEPLPILSAVGAFGQRIERD